MNEKEIKRILNKNRGLLKTADIINANISKNSFYKYLKGSNLEKVAHGIYISSSECIDEMVLLQARNPKVVYSHETALYLHDLAEKEPIPLTVTVPANYNNPVLAKEGIKTVYVKTEWYGLGITEVQALNGEIMLTVYDMERTVCDILRKRSKLDISVFNYAIRTYMNRKNKNLIQLAEYAKIMRLEKKIRETMGILF